TIFLRSLFGVLLVTGCRLLRGGAIVVGWGIEITHRKNEENLHNRNHHVLLGSCPGLYILRHTQQRSCPSWLMPCPCELYAMHNEDHVRLGACPGHVNCTPYTTKIMSVLAHALSM
ncbi:unnamed protein product, partial [Ectocarpus sp. 12 AP-2014]